jgi:predicted small metal-binding protein
MPKHLECVLPGCHFAVAAETEAEIMKQITVHAAVAHGVAEIPPDVAAKVKAAIEDRTEKG